MAKKIYERQVNESPKAFEAFKIYCKLGYERSLEKVGGELGKSETLMERWSSKYNWVERAVEYDNEIQKEEIKKAKREHKLMLDRHMKTAMLLQSKAIDALRNVNPEDLNVDSLLRYIEKGAKMEQEAMERYLRADYDIEILKAEKTRADIEKVKVETIKTEISNAVASGENDDVEDFDAIKEMLNES